ncbi:hypothetical protein HMI55_003795 [Coelomomyces lativittatus]|nr:hypothetical protein HMI55_003795 [Coelomomyces lativittatus]
MMLHPHHHPPSSLPLFNPSSSNFHAHFTFPSNVKKTFPNSTVSSSWTSSLTSSSSSSSFPWSPKPWLPTPFSFSYTLYTCQLKWNLIKHLFFFSTSTSNTNSNSTTQRSSPTNPVRRWGGVRFLLLLFVIGVHFLIHLFLDAWMTMMMTTTTTIPCSGRKGGGNRRDLRIPEGWRSSSSSLVEKRSPSWSLLASSNLQNSSPPSSLKWWVTSVVKEKRTLLPSSSTTTTTTSSSSSRTKNMNESSSSSSSWWWGWWWWWSQEGFTQDFYLTSPTVALTWLHHFTLTPFHLKLNLPLTHFLSEFFSLALVGYHTFFPLHAWIQDGLELWTPCSWTMDTCMGKWEDKEKNGTVFGMHWKKGGRMLFR